MAVAPAYLWLASGLVAACAMEPWAALLHRWVWHTLLWPVHRSHHQGPDDIAAHLGPAGRWQHNDALSLLHAPIAVGLILYGCVGPVGVLRELAYGTGLGMTLFGITYCVVHDGLAHRRLPVQGLLRFRPLRRIALAHRVHHRTGGPPFGLFLGPWLLPTPAQVRRQTHLSLRAAARTGKSQPQPLSRTTPS